MSVSKITRSKSIYKIPLSDFIPKPINDRQVCKSSDFNTYDANIEVNQEPTIVGERLNLDFISKKAYIPIPAAIYNHILTSTI